MKTALVLSLFIIVVAGCNAVDTLKGGFEHANAVSASLEKTLGAKNHVGFNWKNGALMSVNITFESIPKDKSLEEIVSASKNAVTEEFKQTPMNIVVSFSVKP